MRLYCLLFARTSILSLVNIILLEKNELSLEGTAQIHDERFFHLRDILKSTPGDTLACGVINESRGIAQLVSISNDGAVLSYAQKTGEEETLPITLIVGLVRPIQAKRILKIAATYGIRKLWWTHTALGEKSYAHARLWTQREYGVFLREGASQGGRFMLPEVRVFTSPALCLAEAEEGRALCQRFILHPGKDTAGLKHFEVANAISGTVISAIGPERGWTDEELGLFIEKKFVRYHMGPAILRTEAAVNAVLAVLSMKLGFMD